jgi:hypothetical protein
MVYGERGLGRVGGGSPCVRCRLLAHAHFGLQTPDEEIFKVWKEWKPNLLLSRSSAYKI